MQYNKQVNISEFEWLLIQEVRKLQQSGYGDLTIKCCNGVFVDMRTGYTKDSTKLKAIQTPVYMNRQGSTDLCSVVKETHKQAITQTL